MTETNADQPPVVTAPPPPTPTAPSAVASPVARPCPSCGRDWGQGMACQFCGQVGGLPAGVHLASASRRFGGYLLEGLLVAVTLVIG